MRFGAKVQGLVRGPCAHSLSRASLGTGLDYGLGDPRTDQEQKPEMGEVGPGYSQPPKLELSPSVHLILTAAFYLLRASTLTIPYAWNAVPPRCMNFGFSQNSGLPREAYPDHRGSTRATPCDAHRARPAASHRRPPSCPAEHSAISPVSPGAGPGLWAGGGAALHVLKMGPCVHSRRSVRIWQMLLVPHTHRLSNSWSP